MFLQTIIFAATLAATYAQLSYSTPLAYTQHHAPLTYSAPVEAYDAHPQYSFSYGIDDQATGDSKTHQEQRDGDVVHGSYSLIDADGFRRIVEYTADAVNGFNAAVHREPLH